jgi:dienelactone hydrolase
MSQRAPSTVAAFVSVVALALMSLSVFPPLSTAAADTPVPVKMESVSFPSEDGLPITADLYRAKKDAGGPMLVLFHQAGWSRGEYREIAPRLVALGFRCLAVDQRSGGEVNDVRNQTVARASAAGKGTAYLDAIPDVRAALRWARVKQGDGEVIAWGSSYSAALVLRLVGEDPTLADAVLAFAPGEYFERFGKSKTWVREGARKLECPVFVTSARKELPNWKEIFDAIPSKAKTSFVPETDGNHGSRALWSAFDDSPAYWAAVEPFLKSLL